MGYSAFGARLPSLLFAAGSCYLFLRLAKRIPLQRCYLALLLFMLLPVHLQFASTGQAPEQALFLLLLSTGYYFRLLERPTLGASAVYACLLTLCVYTDRYSYLPAFGYLLFLFRFADRPQERRAMWYALPATVLPVVLFLPYYLWSHSQVSPYWLSRPPASQDSGADLYSLQALAGQSWIAYVLIPLLLLGGIAGAWVSFRPDAGAIPRRIRLFCLFGGVLSTVAGTYAADAWMGENFLANQVLWAAPGIVILVFAALEWLAKKRLMPMLAPVPAILLILISAAGDLAYLRNRTQDLQTEAAAIAPELTSDSCVVFVSERFSRSLFLLFAPNLDNRECQNFFHKRVVLASHPYVRPDQQQDAESFFRGLDFTQTKRLGVGGGQIIVMEQNAAERDVSPPIIPR